MAINYYLLKISKNAWKVMPRFFRLALAVLIVLLAYFYPMSSIATSVQPITVKVGIHLLGIDQLDLYRGTYAMDYHLILVCNRVCPKFQLEVMNGTIQFIKEEKSTDTVKIYRIKSLLQDNFNVQNYPFDSYWLRLVLKDQVLDKSKLKFIVDPEQVIIDPGVILHGWQYRFNVKVSSHDQIHPLLKEVYSEYIFKIQLQRPILRGFLKVIFPAVIIMMFSFITFIINSDKVLNRLGIVSGTLLGAVIFHLNLTSSLPPLGYLTYADTFMLINYLILLLVLFENIYVMRLVDATQLEAAAKFDRICLYLVPSIWLICQIITALCFIVII